MNFDLVFELIFDYLTYPDLRECELVDRRFRQICFRKFKLIKSFYYRKPSIGRKSYRDLAVWQQQQQRKKIADNFFDVVSDRFARLESLQLRKVILNSVHLLPLADRLKNLKDFSIIDSEIDEPIIFAEFLKKISRNLQKLTIFVDKCPQADEIKHFASILSNCPELSRLCLKGQFAAKFFPNHRRSRTPLLETLRVQYAVCCRRLSLLDFLSKNKQLKEMEFFAPFVSVDQLREVTSRTTNLQILKCMNFRIFGNDLSLNVSSLTNVGSSLTSLTLIECRFKNMLYFEAINSTSHNLEKLNVSFTNIEKERTHMFINLQNLTKLTSLSIEYFNPDRADIFLKNLHLMANIRHLCLKYIQIEPGVFEYWSPDYLPDLRFIDFHFRYWENLADVCAFGHEKVEQIYLAFKYFHCPLFEREIDQHLYKLARNYPNLKCIKLHRFNDTLSSLKFFAQCPNIHLEYQFSEQPGISENFRDFLLQDCRINMQIYANYDLYVALMKNSEIRSALSQRSWVKFSNSDVVI